MDPEVRPEATGPIEGRVTHESVMQGGGPYVVTTIHVDRSCRPFVTAEGELPRCEENRGGGFYTDCKTCLVCDLPHINAPDLMSYVEHPEKGTEHCVFARQPKTEAEIASAIRAIADSCVGAIRYGGSDPEILRKLEAAGASGAADALRSPGPGA